MNRNECSKQLSKAGQSEMQSGRVIDASENLAGHIRAVLFGDHDQLNADVFDAKTEMMIRFDPGLDTLQISAPKLGVHKPKIVAYADLDDESLSDLVRLLVR